MTKYPPKHLVELNGTESEKELDSMAIYDLATENQELTARLREAEKVIDLIIRKSARWKQLGLAQTVLSIGWLMECESYRQKFPKEEL
jgi:hypothetical protein